MLGRAGRLCHAAAMFANRLLDGLYVEAMLLADEVRAYFDDVGRNARDALGPMDRVIFSCESLKVTTRLMHVIAWLLTQRAVEAGELTPGTAREPGRRLGEAVETDADTLARMPEAARGFIAASVELHRRVARLEAGLDEAIDVPSPAKLLHSRLQTAF
jgi:regulator of CtrA degradation